MEQYQHLLEIVATAMLSRHGVNAIWKLQAAAASAHRSGYSDIAEILAAAADTTEQLWRQRG
jgi:hypothetical protein